jgi:aminoglycoside phosphotransferase family enzyme
MRRIAMVNANQPSSRSVEPSSVTLADKIAFLATPESWLERTACVSVVETHHAWLFMTNRHVYKMKKPFRTGGRDFSSLESRRVLCLDEYRLNRRLAARTYLGVVPLVLKNTGGLALDEAGTVVEWLVKMKRLPETRMLPMLAAEGCVTDSDITRLARKLSRFHDHAPVCRFEKGAYGARLRNSLEFWRTELERCRLELPREPAGRLMAAQSDYLNVRSELIESRQREGRIRIIHGDLRPEHIFMLEDAEPEIIDCLEFDVDLRRLDCAAELAYFAMECRHAGFEWLGKACIVEYRKERADSAGPGHLVAFYASLAATVRAGLMAWRAMETPTAIEWARRVGGYLQDAQHYIARAA